MKITLILINFIFCQQIQAQQKLIQTPFWRGVYNEPQEIQIQALQPGLTEDCSRYAKFIITQAQGLTADDLEFARTLPLAGQMKNNYEVDFQFKKTQRFEKQTENPSLPPDFQIAEPIIDVDFSTLKDIVVPVKAGTFTEISRRLGLSETKVELVKNVSVGAGLIKLNSRDLVCDLLSNSLFLTAKANLQISLNEKDTEILSHFYSEVENRTSDILDGADNNFVKAALLGVSLSEIFEKSSLRDDDVKKNITFLFSSLFKPDSLDLSENWVRIENRNVINFQKGRPLGFGSVLLRMKAL